MVVPHTLEAFLPHSILGTSLHKEYCGILEGDDCTLGTLEFYALGGKRSPMQWYILGRNYDGMADSDALEAVFSHYGILGTPHHKEYCGVLECGASAFQQKTICPKLALR
jgi:hypothetical protein